jgi:hypothetical protein
VVTSRGRLLLLLAFLRAPVHAGPEPEVAMIRLADEGSTQVSIVRATRGSGAAATVVVVAQGPRGGKLFLRRSRPEAWVLLHEAWLGTPPVVALTRLGNEPILLEAGGRSLRFYEPDLGRPTVRCWLGALVSRVEPRLLEAAAGIRLLKEWSGVAALGDVFYPATVLWQASEPSSAAGPRGALKTQKGPFQGRAVGSALEGRAPGARPALNGRRRTDAIDPGPG